MENKELSAVETLKESRPLGVGDFASPLTGKSQLSKVSGCSWKNSLELVNTSSKAGTSRIMDLGYGGAVHSV